MSESGDSGPGRREVAHRLFATEFDAASLEYADSDEERAPKYVITPTGARVNRLFVVGVLTEVERVNDEVVRARVVDPTGAFVVYAGQYQPDALAFLERADPPAFVAVTGKANTFQPEDSDRVYTSVRPESIAEVDGETRDRWTVQAAEHTLGRIDEFARALDRNDVETGATNGIALAREEYGTTPSYLSALRETAIEAATLVAGEVEEVTAPAIGPGEDDGRAVDLDDLHGIGGSGPATVEATDPDTDTAEAEPTDSVETSAEPETEPTEPTTTEPEAPTTEAETAGPEADTPRAPAEPSESDAEPGGAGTEGSSNDLGDFDAGETEPTETEPAGETQADAGTAGEEEIYEFDAEERAEIEAEFDMDFSSGNEVEEPGEAGIDVPDAEAGETTTESEKPETEPVVESEPDEDESEEGEINVEDRAMAAMGELADGDGADRETVVERVAEEYGVTPEDVDDAIESALLSGRCYEPQDGVLKPI